MSNFGILSRQAWRYRTRLYACYCCVTTFLEFYLAETNKMTKLKTSSALSHFLAWVDFNHSVRSVSQQNTTAFDKVITE